MPVFTKRPVQRMNTYWLADTNHKTIETLEAETERRSKAAKNLVQRRQTIGRSDKCLQNIQKTQWDKVVPGDGIEPPTRGFSIRCSTN